MSHKLQLTNPDESHSLLDAFKRVSQRQPDKSAFIELGSLEDSTDCTRLSYSSLYEKASCGSQLLKLQFPTGSRINIYACPGISSVTAYLSVAMADMIPVMVPTPTNRQKASSFQEVIETLSPLCRSIASIVTPEANEIINDNKLILNAVNKQNPLSIDSIFDAQQKGSSAKFNASYDPAQGKLEFPGHIIFTSGTTSIPKPVFLSGSSVSFNLHYTSTRWGFDQDSSIFGLGAPFHSAALMVGYLMSLYVGGTSVISSHKDQEKDPTRILHWLSEFQLSHLACSDSVVESFLAIPAEDFSNLSLSNWQQMIIGGDPLKKSTISRFESLLDKNETASPHIATAYGMTEAAGLIATSGQETATTATISLSEAASGDVVATSHSNGRFVASGGYSSHGVSTVVVDDNNSELPPNRIGRVLFRSPSLFSEYKTIGPAADFLCEVKLSTGEFLPGFMDTGDLGFFSGTKSKELTIIGRYREAINVKGRTIVAPDIECVVEQACPELSNKLFVAVQDPRRARDDSSCVVICEVEADFSTGQTATSVFAALEHIYPKDKFSVIFAPTGSLPKVPTSSKKPRMRIADGLAANSFPIIAEFQQTEVTR